MSALLTSKNALHVLPINANYSNTARILSIAIFKKKKKSTPDACILKKIFFKVIITTTIILGTGSKIEPNYQQPNFNGFIFLSIIFELSSHLAFS